MYIYIYTTVCIFSFNSSITCTRKQDFFFVSHKAHSYCLPDIYLHHNMRSSMDQLLEPCVSPDLFSGHLIKTSQGHDNFFKNNLIY